MKLRILLGYKIRTIDLLADLGLVTSRSDAKRLVNAGAIDVNDQAIGHEYMVWSGDVLRVGKKKFAQVVFGLEPGAGCVAGSHCVHARCVNPYQYDEWPRFEVMG